MADAAGGDEAAQRLRRLQQLGIKRGRAALKPAAPRSAASGQSAAGQTLLELVGGRIVETSFGACHVVETRFALDEARGGASLADTLAIRGAAVAACGRADSLAPFDIRTAAFIDTETSGLAGGAGTFAFMVGIGTFERQTTEDRGQTTEDRGQTTEDRGQTTEDRGQRAEDRGQTIEDRGQTTDDRGQRAGGTDHRSPLTDHRSPLTDHRSPLTDHRSPFTDHPNAGGLDYVVRQVFMDNPGQERALLAVVGQVLARCTGLVSFNGRAFDAPLLENRYLLNREPSPLRGLLHFDLLPPARQRWRLRLPSRALGSLERDILAFQRTQEDVPGWLIPSIYQQYARGGAARTAGVLDDVAHVFYHNLHDVASMAPLAAILCAPFQPGAPATEQLHPLDLVCVARSFEELAWDGQSEAAYRRALNLPLPPAVRAEALGRLGALLKRQERRAEAAELWRDWITSVPGNDPTPYIELAKYHEWHEVDLAAARKWTLWALHLAGQLPPGAERELVQGELQHRLERLERKLEATSAAAGG